MVEDKGFVYRPFEDLERRLRSNGKAVRLPMGNSSNKSCSVASPSVKVSPVKSESPGSPPTSEDDESLFLEAMRDVKPLFPHQMSFSDRIGTPALKLEKVQNEQKIVMRQLQAIVAGNSQVPVSATPEFVEGIGWGVDRHIVHRLHNGEFSVQAYCDLHGMDLLSAMERCEKFLQEAINSFKSCVAIIHGRGLSSKGRPVIKETVTHWLHAGPYRRYIIAFSSAPSWDGGAGVTYVLLRQRAAKRKKMRAGF